MGDTNQNHVGFCNMTMTEKSLKLAGKIWMTNDLCSYQCVVCDCIFSSATLFEQHIPKTHNDSTPAGCVDAQTRRCSLDGGRFRASKESHHNQSNYKIPRRQPDNRHRHVKGDVEPFNCLKCDARFRSLESLRDHNRRRHSYGCVHCVDNTNDANASKTFETEKGLWAHQRNVHPKDFPFQCDVCIRAFNSPKRLKEHEVTKHTRGNYVKCDFCSRMLMSVFQKKNHIQRRHSNRRYYCFLCK